MRALWATLLAACATTPPELATPPDEAPLSRAAGATKLHLLNTGWVRVKEAHRTLDGPAGLRLPAIVVGRAWTEWMPVRVLVIEHPEGVFVVDAGLSEALLDPAHFACDPGNAFVYQHLLRFRASPEQRLDRQLTSLGLPAPRGVVLTHRHADHEGALPHLGAPAVFVGEADWPAPQGALPCRWPEALTPSLVSRPTPLTTDGAVTIEPLPGHSPGHLSVRVRTERGDVLFAGDAAFSLEQLRGRTVAGIVADVDRARDALARLDEELGRGALLLLSHDRGSRERMAAW